MESRHGEKKNNLSLTLIVNHAFEGFFSQTNIKLIILCKITIKRSLIFFLFIYLFIHQYLNQNADGIKCIFISDPPWSRISPYFLSPDP
jgi:hypothetical protein